MADKQGVPSAPAPRYERGFLTPEQEKKVSLLGLGGAEGIAELLNPYPMNLETGERELAAPGLFEGIASAGKAIAGAIQSPIETYKKVAPVLDEMGERAMQSTGLVPGQMAFVDGELRPLTSEEVVSERIEAGMDPTVALTGAAPIAARTAKVGLAGLAAEPGTLTAFGVPATAEKPFVTRGAQFLEEKVKGNFPKDDLLRQIESSDLPTTDKIMLRQAVDAAQTDQKGRINQFSLQDEYEKISPENRTEISVTEPDRYTSFSGIDNLTGKDLGVINIGVRGISQETHLSNDIVSSLDSFLATSRTTPVAEINQKKEALDVLLDDNPDLEFLRKDLDALHNDQVKLSSAYETEDALSSARMYIFSELAKDPSFVPTAGQSWGINKSFDLENPKVLQKMVKKGRLQSVDEVIDPNTPLDAVDRRDLFESASERRTGSMWQYELFDANGKRVSAYDEDELANAAYIRFKDPDVKQETEADFDIVLEVAKEEVFKQSDPAIRSFFKDAEKVLKQSGINPESSEMYYQQLLAAVRNAESNVTTKNYTRQNELVQRAKGIDKKLIKQGYKPDIYRSGQHATLDVNEPNVSPMSFARYADIDGKLPDGSSIDGIHISELQSDYADDLRTYGSRSDSPGADEVNIIKLDAQIERISDQKSDVNLTESQIKELDDEIEQLQKKRNKLGLRVRSAKGKNKGDYYDIPELYPEMQSRGNTQQIIEIIGATMGAVKRGKRSVSFPIPDDVRADAAKPLYNRQKMANNLREAAKRLGPDFSVTMIEFTDKSGNVVQRPGITWSGAEPAIGKENIGGVKMFRGGGIINAKPPVRGNSGIVDVIKKYRRDGMMD